MHRNDGRHALDVRAYEVTGLLIAGCVVAFIGLSLLCGALENKWSERQGRKPDHNDYGERHRTS